MKLNIIILISICLLGAISWFYFYQNGKVPDNYFAVFNGGTSEQTYSTYIYKIENKNNKYEYKYINTINHTVSWSSTELKRRITSRGRVNVLEDIFKVAKDNNAYDYVRLPDKSTISIEEFQNMVITNQSK